MIGLPLARIAGIEIRVQLAWVIIIALVGALTVTQVTDAVPELGGPAAWVIGAIIGLGFFLSALAHDMAHALVARRTGVPVPFVVVSFFGGSAPGDAAGRRPLDEVLIGLAGPAVSITVGLVLGVAAVTLDGLDSELGRVMAPAVAALAVLNVFLGLVNLVPAYPLDGGRIVRAIAWRRSGSPASSWRTAAVVGRVVGIVVAICGIPLAVWSDLSSGVLLALCGWFLVMTARAIGDRTALEELFAGRTVADATEQDLPSVVPGLTVDTFVEQFLVGTDPGVVFPVIQAGDVVGVVGPSQAQRLRRASWPETRVEAIMRGRAGLRVLGPAEPLLRGLDLLRRQRIEGLPVVGPEGYVGMFTLRAIGQLARARDGDQGGASGTGARRRRPWEA
jgi:Zn-dependent protease